MKERQWSADELQALALRGLAITPHSDAANGWGYTWQGRECTCSFPTPDAALHAAFTEAQEALQFRSDYAWVLSAQSGEHRQFNGESWVQVDGSQKRERRDIETSDVEAQARQDWSNDE
ncbi:MAG TPA: hypothetical protein VKB35_00970 [Ktedonobacteraceae bacterium]|nr:hypothetical protein [Ktedonobacteraceae bacterium]